jgi:hypothetical protein
MPELRNEVVDMIEKEPTVVIKKAALIANVYILDDLRREFIDVLMTWLSFAGNNVVLLNALAKMMNTLSSEFEHFNYTVNAKNN